MTQNFHSKTIRASLIGDRTLGKEAETLRRNSELDHGKIWRDQLAPFRDFFLRQVVVLVCALSLGAGLVDRAVGKGSPVRVARHWQSWGWGQSCLAQSAEPTLHPNQASGGGRWVLIPLQLLIQLPMLAGPQTPALPSPL